LHLKAAQIEEPVMKGVIISTIAAFLALLVIPSTGYCSPVPTEKTEVTFAYFPLAVPISVLGETLQRDRILQKNLSRHGVKIAFKQFEKGNDALPLINKGQIDAVAFADMPTIEAATNGDMLIIGLVKQSYSAVVTTYGSQTANLRKKRIGNAHGSTSHYALLQALAAAGMSEQDVTLVPLATNEMIEALESGKIDAFAAWEPTPTEALKKHPGRFIQINRQTSFSFFLLSNNLASKHPETAREITAALVRAIRWLKKSDANLLKASRWALTGAETFTGKRSKLNELDIARITHTDLLDLAGAPAIPASLSKDGSFLLQELESLNKSIKSLQTHQKTA
jgi:ABC-type nitrate/sulfonate/bicarbonate transport system substrate-binding protein